MPDPREGRSVGRKPVTVPVRVPDAIYADLRRWAQLKRKTPGDLLREAWDEWLRAHKSEILAELDRLRAEVEHDSRNVCRDEPTRSEER